MPLDFGEGHEHVDEEGFADFSFLVVDAVLSHIVSAGGGPFSGHFEFGSGGLDGGNTSRPEIDFSDLIRKLQDAGKGGDFAEDIHDAFEFEGGGDFLPDVEAGAVAEGAFAMAQEAGDEVGNSL